MTALARVDHRTALEPVGVDDTLKLAQILVQSRLLPKGVPSPEAAFTIIVTGRELGLSPMQSLRSIHIIEGRPTMSADLMAALVKRSPACVYFRLVESTADVATYETERAGEGSTRMSFTIGEARAAGLVQKDVWRRYPAAMLRARCIAALSRAVFPDVLLGVYETSELEPAAREGSTFEVVSSDPPTPAPPAVTRHLPELPADGKPDALGFREGAGESPPPAAQVEAPTEKRAQHMTKRAEPAWVETLRVRCKQLDVPATVFKEHYAGIKSGAITLEQALASCEQVWAFGNYRAMIEGESAVSPAELDKLRRAIVADKALSEQQIQELLRTIRHRPTTATPPQERQAKRTDERDPERAAIVAEGEVNEKTWPKVERPVWDGIVGGSKHES